jgi:phosphoenolpyruvate-protein phosphotransferase (PTS system enzyme I)
MSTTPTTVEKRMLRFKGVSINSGRVLGSSCLYNAERHKVVQQYSLANESLIDAEVAKFDEVLQLCSGELDEIARQVEDSVGKVESEIFITQKHIMNDPKVVESIRQMVTESRKNVEWAISDVLSDYEEKFASLDNEYLRERSSDIGEIRRRLLDRISRKEGGLICEGQTHCSKGADRIVVAHELTADMVARLNIDRVLGFVTEYGGITSHAAIIARSLGVPAVSGIHGIMEFVRCGDRIAIDGESGEVFLYPDPATVVAMMPVEPIQKDNVCILDTPQGMQLLANASSMEDVRQAASVGADGIGLLRTEILFIKEDRLLGEDEQYEYYWNIVNLMGDRTVTFRMLDVGGDKPLSFLRLKKEDNPYLGWRGSRFLLGNPDIFSTQLRALARVSLKIPLKVLFPMVVDAGQLHGLMELAGNVLGEFESGKTQIEFGVMFEVPSAFIEAEEILAQVDFASIGSNDLIQYLFAIDRNNELVSQDYDPEHPVLWKLLEQLSATARNRGKPLSICGDIASREGLQQRLLDIGISSLSVPPRMVPRVRNEMARYAGILS